jgi:hypothetical protein
MACGPASGWPFHGSTVDSTVVGGGGSLELGLTSAPVHGGSPAMEQWRKEHMGRTEREREEVRCRTMRLSPFIGAEGGGVGAVARNGGWRQ